MEVQIRPAFHVPAVWLTVDRSDGTVDYFELDDEGNLVFTSDGRLIPHHTETKQTSQCFFSDFTGYSDDSTSSLTNDSDFVEGPTLNSPFNNVSL
ncbi:hypothetical protein M9Y10_016671 [Tritrichomonas musculus]|uniref:Uncharacterized protein n=1 Tax=Tritrichomonas musculus TaxID=1915356 RepID=A0ABR2HX85_9EUKA